MATSIKPRGKGILAGYSAIEKKRLLFVLALLAFPILQFAVFYIYINIDSFVLAFTDKDGILNCHYLKVVLDDFFKKSGDGNLWLSLGRSVIQWSISMLFVFPVSILFTYALFKHVKGEMFFRVLFYLPGIIGTVVFGVVYRAIMETNGPFEDILKFLGLASSEILEHGFLYAPSTRFFGVILFGVWMAIGGNIVILTGAMTRIPNEIFESASLEGVGVVREFFQLVLPLIWPTLSTLIIYQLGAITTFDFGTYVLFDNTGRFTSVQTMGYYLFLLTYEVSQFREVPNHPAALGMILTIITVPVVLVLRWAIDKFSDKVEF